MSKLRLLTLVLAAVTSITFVSCANKNTKAEETAEEAIIAAEDTERDADAEVTDESLSDEANIRDTFAFLKDGKLQNVPFNYDKYELSEEARSIIRDNAMFLNANKNLTIVVEGYCDNRGTTEYNLSLGQKRANAVRDYYLRLGVNPSKIGTISYGLERPLCNEDSEACWKLNRRAETKVK